jgi:hypothetical protein
MSNRGDRAEDGELDRGGQVGSRSVEDRPEELALGNRAVLQDVDRPEVGNGTVECGREGLGVAGVGCVAAGDDTRLPQVSRERVDIDRAAGDSATSRPPAPNLRATAAPRPSPVPTMAMVDVIVFLQCRGDRTLSAGSVGCLDGDGGPVLDTGDDVDGSWFEAAATDQVVGVGEVAVEEGEVAPGCVDGELAGGACGYVVLGGDPLGQVADLSRCRGSRSGSW